MIDIISIVTIIGITQALFLLALLVPKLRQSKPTRYAIFLILVFLLDFSMYLMLNFQLFVRVPFLIGLGEVTLFLYGPVLYLYSKSVLSTNEKNSSMKSSYPHFAIALIAFVLLSPLFLRETTLSFLNTLENNLPEVLSIYNVKDLLFNFLLWYIHALVYFFATLRLVSYSKKNIPPSKDRGYIRHIKWVRTLLAGYFLFAFIYGGGFILDPFFNLRTLSFEVLTAFLVFHIFVISYIGFTNQKILITPLNKLRYSKSTLSENKKEEYLEKILTYFEHDKPYLDQNLTLKKVASRLDILQNHVSQVINEKLGQGFSEFVNGYRINMAKVYLLDASKDMLTIEGIAYEVGFKSKSSFNNAFKNECGTTPSMFKTTKLSK